MFLSLYVTPFASRLFFGGATKAKTSTKTCFEDIDRCVRASSLLFSDNIKNIWHLAIILRIKIILSITALISILQVGYIATASVWFKRRRRIMILCSNTLVSGTMRMVEDVMAT